MRRSLIQQSRSSISRRSNASIEFRRSRFSNATSYESATRTPYHCQPEFHDAIFADSSPAHDATKGNESTTTNTENETAISSSYMLGLFFIFSVSIVSSASCVLLQFMYNRSNENDDSNSDQQKHDGNSLTPFLVTYVGVSLFTILLPLQFAYDFIAVRFFDEKPSRHQIQVYENVLINPASKVVAVVGFEEAFQRGQTIEHHITSKSDDNSSYCSGVSEFINQIDNETKAELEELDHVWTYGNYMRTSLQIAPVWFIANWAYTSSLCYTSITSCTVLTSTASLFTFMFALLSKDETFVLLKLIGVVVGVSGSIATAFNDLNSNESSGGTNDGSPISSSDVAEYFHHPHAFFGDMLSVLSAIGYALYAVQTRVLCPRDESLFQMQLLLGYIGLISTVALSPIAIHQLFYAGVTISWSTMGLLVLNGLLSCVLSDYLWLRGAILTSATVASVGLGLMIPLAFFSDIMMGHGASVLTLHSLSGAALVLIGFAFVNVSDLDSPVPVIDVMQNEKDNYFDRRDTEHTPLSVIFDTSERSLGNDYNFD